MDYGSGMTAAELSSDGRSRLTWPFIISYHGENGFQVEHIPFVSLTILGLITGAATEVALGSMFNRADADIPCNCIK